MNEKAPRRGTESTRSPGLVVEVIGPAAAGKTTLIRALSANDPNIRVGVDVGMLRYVGGFVRTIGSWMPQWAATYRGDRWFSWRETKSVVFLDAWYPALQRQRDPAASVTILDHGALYRLARLREFGPQIVHSEAFERWWVSSLDRWMKSIDVVVWLDGSDEVLLQRVKQRGHRTLASTPSDHAKREFLARYRRAFDGLFEEAGPDQPTILRLRSDEGSVAAIAAHVLSVLRSHRMNGAAQDQIA